MGNGVADKNLNPTDFIKVAQKNALQNLISQIKVSISSQSFLLKMERDLDFKQDIKSVIEIKADDVIEGYELVNSFTNNNEYWVYYRLNKSLYKEIKIAKTKDDMHIRWSPKLGIAIIFFLIFNMPFPKIFNSLLVETLLMPI